MLAGPPNFTDLDHFETPYLHGLPNLQSPGGRTQAGTISKCANKPSQNAFASAWRWQGARFGQVDRWTSTTPSLQISGLCHLRMSGEVCILDVLWHAYLSSPPCLLVRLPLCVHTPAFAGCYNHRNSINSQQEGPIKSLSTIQQPRLEGFINHGWLNTHDITNHNQLSCNLREVI